MAGFNEYRLAAKMRDVIRDIVRSEVERVRPADTYATVVSIDLDARLCQVRLPEDEAADSLVVGMGSIYPTEVGQTVRIAGPVDGRYIADVMDALDVEVAPPEPFEPTFVAPVSAGAANVTGTSDDFNRGDHSHAGGIRIIANAAARPGSPIDGETVIEIDNNRMVQSTGSAWRRGPHFVSNGRTGVYVARTNILSIPDGGAFSTPLPWDVEPFDSDAFMPTPDGSTTTTATCPNAETAGYYLISFHAQMSSVVGARAFIEIIHGFGGGGFAYHRQNISDDDRGTISTGVEIASGDTIQGGVWQNSGGAVDLDGAYLQAYRLFS